MSISKEDLKLLSDSDLKDLLAWKKMQIEHNKLLKPVLGKLTRFLTNLDKKLEEDPSVAIQEKYKAYITEFYEKMFKKE